MIYVDEERCTGCGLCVEACPTGAMRLVDGVAQVEQSLCRECKVCLSACPNGGILAIQEPTPVSAPASISPTQPVTPALRPGGLRPWLGVSLWENRGRLGVFSCHPADISNRRNYGRRDRGRRTRRRRRHW